MWKRVTWSPVEEAYLKAHGGDPINQLCQALAKSRNAIKKKQAEQGCNGKPGKKTLGKSSTFPKSKLGTRKDLGIFLRSGWEANVLRFLKYKSEELGITLIEYEPHDFTYWQFGIKKGTVSYTPDFKVTYADGSYNWIEVKGGFLKTTDKTKIRRFQKYYPTEFERLISITPGPTSKTVAFFQSVGVPVRWHYPELNKQYRKIVPNWE
jgi:hypothetical protein